MFSFDNIPHALLLKAVDKHATAPWMKLYIQRWLTAPMEYSNGESITREQGTPQGGVISPVLANLFLHYAFDTWLSKYYPNNPWCRYADDGVIHCRSEMEAKVILEALSNRFNECGLEIHPLKTKIIYCKDGSRKGNYPNTEFSFLGYTFRRRICKNRKRNSLFLNFTPAVSKSSLKSMKFKIRKLRVRMATNMSIGQLSRWLNPIIRGWIGYYGKYTRSALYSMCRHVNKTLVRWAMRKYKSLRRYKTKAGLFLEGISKQNPLLFAHWRIGMIGAFA